MINYSIIIPHKNIPQLLQRCLDSIPVRDDVQVIVIDDNSDVDKVDFDHFPQWKGKHYETYFTKEGRGAGYARNVGLEHTVGKWVLFADADDFLSEDANRIFDENVDNNADIVFFRPKSVMSENISIPSNRDKIINQVIDDYFQSGNETILRTHIFEPWSKIIKAAFIQKYKLNFEEIPYSNDCMFSCRCGITAKKIDVENDCIYISTSRNNSLASNFCSKEGELGCRAEAFFRVCYLLYSKGYELDYPLYYSYLGLLLKSNIMLFREGCKWLMTIKKYSITQLINEIFRHNKPISRIKRSIYAYYILRIKIS